MTKSNPIASGDVGDSAHVRDQIIFQQNIAAGCAGSVVVFELEDDYAIGAGDAGHEAIAAHRHVLDRGPHGGRANWRSLVASGKRPIRGLPDKVVTFPKHSVGGINLKLALRVVSGFRVDDVRGNGIDVVLVV